jgi:hypothetical protein
VLAVAGALLVFVFKDRDFRTSFDHVLGGTVVGLVIVGGWYVTGHLGYAENPETLENTFFGTNSRTIESLSFTSPVAYTLELLMLGAIARWGSPSASVPRSASSRAPSPTRARRRLSAGKGSPAPKTPPTT